MFGRLIPSAAALWLLLAFSAQAADVRLIMVEQPGCAYCAMWDHQIGEAYPKTAEGQFAPLQRAQLKDGAPDGIAFDRRVLLTPTFILVRDGAEVARMEGYVGEDFFWPVFAQFLERHTDFDAPEF